MKTVIWLTIFAFALGLVIGGYLVLFSVFNWLAKTLMEIL